MIKITHKKPILIFDFDGTIVDSHQYIIDISNRLAEEFKYKKILPQEVAAMKEKTAKEMISTLRVPMLKVPSIISKAKKEFYAGIHELKPIHGLKNVLIKLKASGIEMGILSSNNQKNIKAFLKQHQLEDLFDFVHTTSKVWTKNVSLKKLVKKYPFTLEDIIYVGDETRDITAAKKINVRIIAVSWGYNSAKVLKKFEPDYLINSPKDLLKFIV